MPESRDPRLETVAVRTLGCKVNQADGRAIVESLVENGLRVSRDDEAGVVVINTCTVTAEADRKARKAVRNALRAPSAPTVVVTGCAAAVDGDALGALGDRVVVEPDGSRVARAVFEALGRRGSVRASLPTGDPFEAVRAAGSDSIPCGFASRHRVQVKVQDGCDCGCAYCIVPRARGAPRSTPLAQVVERVASLASAGVREVVLTGINIGRYDDDGVRLPALVRAVAGTGVSRIRLSSVEPQDVDGALLQAAAEAPGFCPHLHIPLQSGSGRVLAAMGRTCDAERFAGIVAAAREALPGLAVSTDVMVGFPGETDSDAEETLAFVERIGFTRMHVFRFSARPGTPAAGLAGRVPPATAAARARRVRRLGDRLASGYAGSRVGGVAEVLVERVLADGVAEGTSEDYVRVRVVALDAGGGIAGSEAAATSGELVSVTIDRAEGAVLSGRRRRVQDEPVPRDSARGMAAGGRMRSEGPGGAEGGRNGAA